MVDMVYLATDRHAQIIEIVKRSLPQQSQLDYRPDGLTMTTWKQGKCLIWDVTVADTLCQSYVYQSSKNPGAAAETREIEKTKKYQELANNYYFVPIGIETYGS